MTRQEVIDLICRKADEYGIDRAEFLGGAIAESNLDPDAARYGAWPDVSFGLWQQTVAYADEGDHSQSPENIALIKRLYSDPEHAADVAAKKYLYWRHGPDVPAEQAWAAYNWPGSYRHYQDNPNLENYRRGLHEAAALLASSPQEPPMPTAPRLITTDDLNLRESPDAASKILTMVKQGTAVEPLDTRAWRHVRANGREGWMAADYLEDAPAGPVVAALAYNPDFALRLQIADYACSIRTTQMILESVGIPVDIGMLQDQMVPRYVTPEVGLRDASGAGIVAVLRDHYGVVAENYSPATWDGVVAVAGHLPVGLGGHGWPNGSGPGHWVAVRRFNGSALELGNPAGTGPLFGQQTIDRHGWQTIASAWSAVVITGRV